MLVYQRVDFGMCIDLLERTSQTHVAVFKSHKLSGTCLSFGAPKRYGTDFARSNWDTDTLIPNI